jgi:hypothetical protein
VAHSHVSARASRTHPQWWFALQVVWVLWYLPAHLLPDAQQSALVLGYPVFYGCAIFCLIYRYVRVSTPVERQQTKWIAFGLAGIYLLGVVGVQSALNQFVGHSRDTSAPMVVVTTLVVAALFQPLRRVIQATIDRRFYRTKYNAAATVADFGAALRRELDLDACQDHLLEAVEKTM